MLYISILLDPDKSLNCPKFMPVYGRKEVFLCVYFKESQWGNTALVAGIVQSTYALVARLFLTAAMYVQSVILISVVTARFMVSARKYGERWLTYEDDKL